MQKSRERRRRQVGKLEILSKKNPPGLGPGLIECERSGVESRYLTSEMKIHTKASSYYPASE